nr:Chain E, PA14 peptide [Homo sapiens]4YO0_F Chain F, PA14 peptide [Homo sapiens]5XCV_C Chain C, PA14 peptide [Homo sapiens]5XCV_F Chain F, PA14 peptide [Homo sapiens]
EGGVAMPGAEDDVV